MSPRCDTREDENSAKLRARNILQKAKPGKANCVHGGRVGKVGFDALGTQKPVPVSRRTGFCESGSYSYFQESGTESTTRRGVVFGRLD